MVNYFMRNRRFRIGADMLMLLHGTLDRWCREMNAVPGRFTLSFVGRPPHAALDVIFHEYGWDTLTDGPTGDIVDIYYTDPPATHATHVTTTINFFQQVAPFVDEGCYIEMVSTDGDGHFADLWRWYFDGRTVERQDGTAVYRVKECPLKFKSCKNCVFSLLCLSGQEPPISVGECCECGKRVYFHKKKREIINV